MQKEFEKALDRLNLREAVQWTTTNDVAPFYRRSRVFLLCSVNEGLSLACMEAMACGTVPVVTDCGDMAEVVRSGETGFLLPSDSPPDAFAGTVLSLLSDDAQWRTCSENAIRLITNEHDFAAAIKGWQDFFESKDKSRVDLVSRGR